MCAENVLRLASIDCSSPMSAKIDRNTGSRDPSAAGIRSPACAISASRPAVLSATVLPPVFGPVMSSTVGRRHNLDGDRHGLLQQRMPRRLQLERPVGRQPRLDAVDRLREPGARLANVELGGRLDRPLQIHRPRAERVGQRQQDAADLFGFLLLQRDDVVVDFDRAQAARGKGSRRSSTRRATMPGMLLRCSVFTTST